MTADRKSELQSVEAALAELIPADSALACDLAARYSLLAGGKRIRPLLFLTTAALCGVEEKTALPFALALELIHTYSLIHDDLPAMDDDDMRRGRPSCHRAFDEATAILAGDLLLNLAYETLFQALLADGGSHRIEAAHQIAAAAGRQGMIAGQTMDLSGAVDRSDEESALAYLTALQIHKTGALIEASVLAAALLGQAPDPWFGPLCLMARALGRAFQLQDDLLDVLGSEASLGKTTGKDLRDDKLTFVTLLGIERTRGLLAEQTEHCRRSLRQLDVLGADTRRLSSLVESILARNA